MENKKLPKQHKGYDVEILMKKCSDGIDLTNEEENIFWEIMQKYHKEEMDILFENKGKMCLAPANPKLEGVSELNDALPRFYDGHDVDEMFRKYLNGMKLDMEEDVILDDVIYKYYFNKRDNTKDLAINGITIYPARSTINPILRCLK